MKGSDRNSVSTFPNKYELAILAAREARRVNEILRRSGEEAKGKVTLMAIERVAKGKVKYAYQAEEERGE